MNACLVCLGALVAGLLAQAGLAGARDYYVGMFKRNDYLVAQDTLYAQRVPFNIAYAKYGRVFSCPITYFRVVDRLGVGRGPSVRVIRGGLGHKYLVLKLASSYDRPISANLYVGCSSQKTTRPPPAPSSDEQDTTEDNVSSDERQTKGFTTNTRSAVTKANYTTNIETRDLPAATTAAALTQQSSPGNASAAPSPAAPGNASLAG
ncbi:uncharacterized protein LOC119629904 [Bombyx mori]|uniref:Uncharacterized protein n=1 Tax=Bombyx mori TaxID=7091 RepID=A0A8R2QZW0_BOMMO|nr:uncharacterized protein LOC119629904 [Bombyx mori]